LSILGKSALVALLIFKAAGPLLHAAPQATHSQSSPAQPGNALASEVPPAGDPDVAYLFLLHYQGLLKEVTKIAASSADETVATRKAAAASMRVDVKDFDAIATVYTQVEPLLEAVDQDANRYRDSVISGAVLLDVKVLRQLDARKARIKASIRDRLQAVLSPVGWAALSGYIDGEFRQGVRTVRGIQ